LVTFLENSSSIFQSSITRAFCVRLSMSTRNASRTRRSLHEKYLIIQCHISKRDQFGIHHTLSGCICGWFQLIL
jgi:beta-galactosidase beta subunit